MQRKFYSCWFFILLHTPLSLSYVYTVSVVFFQKKVTHTCAFHIDSTENSSTENIIAFALYFWFSNLVVFFEVDIIDTEVHIVNTIIEWKKNEYIKKSIENEVKINDTRNK